jgi:voltage-gated potassium channel
VSHWRRLMGAVALLFAVLVVGTLGYLALGFDFVDAMYQTVTTVATVGFREVRPLSTGGKFFTMALILVGVSSTLYAIGTETELSALAELVGGA